MFRAIFNSFFMVFLITSLYYSQAQAVELSRLDPPPANVPSFADDTLIDKDVGFNALVRLERADGNICTGIAIRTTENPSSPAFVIAAGHCHWLLTSEIVTNLTPKGSQRIKARFNQFHDATVAEQFTITIKKISYATMRGQDIAIFELNATQGQLAARKILLPKLASTLPSTGINMTTYGSRAAEPLMRAINCTLENRVNLNEGKWLWWDALRADCPRADLITGGASGSPVYLQGTANELFGILNTVNTRSLPNILCSDNNPCELNKNKPISRMNSVYLMDIHRLQYCFTSSGKFNHQLKACPLPKHLASYTQFKRTPDPSVSMFDQAFFESQARYPNPKYLQTHYTFTGTLATERYQMQLTKPASAATEAYRYKLGKLANFDPYDPSGYSEPTTASTLALPYPTQAGTYIASVVPVKNYNSTRLNPQALYTDIFEIVYKNPLKIKKVTISETSHPFIKNLSFDHIEGNAILINSLNALAYQVGPKLSTNCKDFKKYKSTYYSKQMEFGPIQIKAGDKLCLAVVDRALNASDPYEYIQP